MSYATIAEFKARFPESESLALTTQDDPDATMPDDAKIQTALDDVSAEIDSILGQRYTVPITPIPPDLVWVAIDLARYRLDLQRTEPREDVVKRAEYARRWLQEVAEWMRTLPGATSLRRRLLCNPVEARFSDERLEGFAS